MPATRLVFGLGVTIALGLGLATASFVSAAPPSIRILELHCNDQPERVVIENSGDEVLDLGGWTLESDELDETLSLMTPLAPGESTTVRILDLNFFRDADASDFARIVDPTGAVADQVNCAETVVDPPSPAGVAESSAGLPASDVPNGGGAPPDAGESSSAGLLILIGASAVIFGLSVVTLPQLRGLTHGSGRIELQPPAAAAQAPANHAHRGANAVRRSAPSRSSRHFLLMGIASGIAAVLLSLLWKRLR